MMWGPGVARATADVVLHGTTDLVDLTDLGLDRFDADGRSRLAADPIALPFPQRTRSDDTPHVTDASTPSSRTGARWRRRPARDDHLGIEVWVDGDASGGIWQCTPGPSHWTLETTR